MGERPTFPTERDLWEARREELSLETHVAYPGRIQSYDPVLQVADVVPLIRQQVPDDSTDLGYRFEEFPIVPCCPVIFPRVAGHFIAFKISPGDYVQLLVNTSAIGHWRVGSGDITDPGDLRRQHLAHAVALPGLYPRQQALAHAPDGDAALTVGSDEANGTRLTFKTNGHLVVTRGAVMLVEMEPDGTVHLGGPGLTALLDGVVTAQGIDPFTGATYGALGNASSKVLARKG